MIKEQIETHQKGSLSVDKTITSMIDCDFGIKIAEDGRVWICIDGQSVLRFKPEWSTKKEK